VVCHAVYARCRWTSIRSGCFTDAPAHATEQIKDEIVLDGRTHQLLDFPLGHAAEWSHAARATLRDSDCSAAWRGYQAFWEVRDEKLWLGRVLGDPCNRRREIPLDLIFPDAVSTPLPATWFSGQLAVSYDDFVEQGRVMKRKFRNRNVWDQ
jgi:hypothetical protein